MNPEELVACEECDTLHRRLALDNHSAAHCVRCGAVLYRRVTDNVDRLLAITLTALITYLIAQAFPIVELELNGMSTSATLSGAITILWSENMQMVAIVVFCTTIVVPLAEMLVMLYLLVPLRAGYKPPGFNLMLRTIQSLRPWGMVEVLMLGMLVTLVKMSSIARVLPQQAIFAFGALTFMIAALSAFDPRNMWRIAAELPQRHAPPMHWRPVGRLGGNRARLANMPKPPSAPRQP